MYHAIVKRICRRNFERVNAHDYEPLLAACLPEVHHRFEGDHALGGSATTSKRYAPGSSDWAACAPRCA